MYSRLAAYNEKLMSLTATASSAENDEAEFITLGCQVDLFFYLISMSTGESSEQ
jgi:hypothetical protein